MLVAIKACGVNYPDVLTIQDLYQTKPPRPFSPGTEIAGVVEQAGAGVTAFKAGDKVFGAIGHGGMAEKIAVPADRLSPIPEGMSFEDASAFSSMYNTSYMALKDRADIKPGERLLVLGAAGGVGIAAVELGKAFGAHVIAAASSQAKVDAARRPAPTKASSIRAVRSIAQARRRSPNCSRALPARRVSTSSTIRSAATTPRRHCARWHGAGASSSSASRPASRRFR